MFLYNLLMRAKKNRKHIVLPEGEDERILRATSRLVALDIVDITLLGNEKAIKNTIEKLGIPINFDKVNIINPAKSKYCEDYANTFYELRKHKNVNIGS